jgi:hypothetical protein
MAMNNMMLAQVCVRVFIECDRFRRWDDKNRGCFYSFVYFNFSSLFVCFLFVCLFICSTIDVGGRYRDYCYYLLRSYHENGACTHRFASSFYCSCSSRLLPADRNTHQLMKDMQVGNRSICCFPFLLLPGEHVVGPVF